jgi:hypothetical protein
MPEISGSLPSGCLWHADPKTIGYVKFRSRSHHAVIRVFDEAGNVIEMRERPEDFKEW